MNFGILAAKNVLRNKPRTVMTVLGVAVAIVTFVLLRTVLFAWTIASEMAAQDRVGTRNKITFIEPLPRRYVEDIRGIDGVEVATWANWFGGKDPRHENEFFQALATEPTSLLEVYEEMELPPAQAEAWKANRQGAIVGDVLAKKLGWRIGDRVTLVSNIFDGEWSFTIEGIYTPTRQTLDRNSFYFHWSYLNETLPPYRHDMIGWVISRVSDPSRTAEIASRIDRMFEERDIQTLSMSERALSVSVLGMISAILKTVEVVSLVILIIMMLILGNTIAMGVRERTREYGTLRAIGFLPRHVLLFVLGEAVTTGLLGGGLGLLISYPLVERGVGRWLEENMGSFFPYFRIPATTAAWAVLLAILLGVVAAILPAYRASRLKIVDSLRKIG